MKWATTGLTQWSNKSLNSSGVHTNNIYWYAWTVSAVQFTLSTSSYHANKAPTTAGKYLCPICKQTLKQSFSRPSDLAGGLSINDLQPKSTVPMYCGHSNKKLKLNTNSCNTTDQSLQNLLFGTLAKKKNNHSPIKPTGVRDGINGA